MDDEVDFTVEDILDFFRVKGGRVIYSELVTHFKNALSDPRTQVKARILFKDYVNTVANVSNENGKKYLVLRSKYMKKLFDVSAESVQVVHSNSNGISPKPSGVVYQKPTVPPPPPPTNNHVTTSSVIAKESLSSAPPPIPPHQNHHPPPPPVINHHHPPSYYHQNHVPKHVLPHHPNHVQPHHPNHVQPHHPNHVQPHHLNHVQPHHPNHVQSHHTNHIQAHPNHVQLHHPNNVQSHPPHLNYNHHPRVPVVSPEKSREYVQMRTSLPVLQTIPENHHQQVQLCHQLSSPPSDRHNGINGVANPTVGAIHRHSFAGIEEPDTPPRPPPRKKNSFSKAIKPNVLPSTSVAGGGDTKLDMMTSTPSATEKPVEANLCHTVKREIQELAKTPGRVKEHAQILNKMAQDNNFRLPMPGNTMHAHVVHKIRNNAHSDTDSGSLQILEAHKKQWIIASSSCDFNQMLSLLKEDPKLCAFTDFVLGYNALHWAAKFNKPEIVKLIAGQYAVDPNVKSFSGSTPLHIAAQFNNQDIMKMLTDLYGANPDIRDNYGRKAMHCLPRRTTEEETGEQNSTNHHSETGSDPTAKTTGKTNESTGQTLSATETLKINLRNKLSHQSMLVRNTFRKSKAFRKRKTSMKEEAKAKT